MEFCPVRRYCAAFIMCVLFSLPSILNARPEFPSQMARHQSAAKAAFNRSDDAASRLAYAEMRRVADSLQAPWLHLWIVLEEAEAAYFLVATADSLPAVHERLQAAIAASPSRATQHLLHAHAALLHLRNNQVEAARLDLARSDALFATRRRHDDSGDRPGQWANGLLALAKGLLAITDEDYQHATQEIGRAILNLKNLPEQKRWHALAHREMGYAYDELRNTDRAIAYGRQSTILHEAVFGRMHRQTALAYRRLGRSCIIVDYNDDALNAYQQSMDILRAVYGPAHPEVHKAFNGLGNCYVNLKDSARAEAAYLKALQGVRATDGPNSMAAASLYRNLGILYNDFGNGPLARGYWYKDIAITLQLRGPHSLEVATRLSWIADSYAEQGLHADALNAINASIKTLTPLADTSGQCAGPAIHADAAAQYAYAKAMNIKGEIHFRHYQHQHQKLDLDCAYNSLKTGLLIIDSVRMGFHGSQAHLADLEVTYPYYESIIEVCLAQHTLTKAPHWLDQAFYYMEKSKSNLLNSALRLNMVGEHGPHLQWLGQEKALRKQIDSLELQAYELGKSGLPMQHPELVRLRQAVFHAQEDLQNFLSEVEASDPQFYQLRYGTPVPSLAELRQALPDAQTLFLEYFVGERHLFLLALSAGEARILQLPVDRLEPAVEAFLAQFDGRAHNLLHAKRNFIGSSQALYGQLIQPIAALLPAEGRLIIVPDGKLGYVPFEALLNNQVALSPTIPYKDLPYLLRNHSVSYASSGTALRMVARQERRKSEMRLMAFAPSFEPAPVQLDGAYAYANAVEHKELVATRSAFSQVPLHYTSEEVQRIGHYFKGEVYEGATATESRFKQSAKDFTILHFATHGTIQDGNPLFSSIAFSPEKNGMEDGLLHTLELFDMRLDAQLAVLSACNTGKGKIQRGEGIMSLARGFMYAGCPSIVMSLWAVDDAASATIMEEFYRQLSKGRSKDDALRTAKLAYLDGAEESKAHPYYWAAHVMIGDASGFRGNYQGWAWAVVVLGLVAIVVVFEVRKSA